MTGEAGDDTGLHWTGGGKSRQESTDLRKVCRTSPQGGRYWAAGREEEEQSRPPGIVQPEHLEYRGACPVQRGNTGLGRKWWTNYQWDFWAGVTCFVRVSRHRLFQLSASLGMALWLLGHVSWLGQGLAGCDNDIWEAGCSCLAGCFRECMDEGDTFPVLEEFTPLRGDGEYRREQRGGRRYMYWLVTEPVPSRFWSYIIFIVKPPWIPLPTFHPHNWGPPLAPHGTHYSI